MAYEIVGMYKDEEQAKQVVANLKKNGSEAYHCFRWVVMREVKE